MSSNYTCNNCGIAFNNSNDQRSHMKSEWHRYNLKRRIAQLPPITESAFNEKSINNELNSNNNSDEQKTKENKNKNRTVTKKELKIQKKKLELAEKKKKLLELARLQINNATSNNDKKNSNNNDSESRSGDLEVTNRKIEEKGSQLKEISTLQTKQKDIEDELNKLSIEDQEEYLINKKLEQNLKYKISPNTCLFCTKNKKQDFASLDDNINHMFKNHGLYVPEQKFLIDKFGLIKYLSEKISIGNVCIVCNYQSKDLNSIRSHMIDKQHCYIPYETLDQKLELGSFYDFTSTYNEVDARSKFESKIEESSNDMDQNEDDWEDVSDEDFSDDENNVTPQSEKENDEDEDEAPIDYLYTDGVELHLPSGLKVGHRSLVRYYKQDIKPEKTYSEGQKTVMTVESRSKYMLAPTTIDKKTYIQNKQIWKTKQKFDDLNFKRSQKFINNQPHYRDQLLQ
ncbi:Rei1p ASCRUDRAFT_76549 [Ascoidea rubescens DSM 1968]|uniref:C2H2-type domain-containing protein n=1 Tax=Ascoidea rubescens DSM 1968 TaxID=1344418 RepID=A0A1D2VEF5_9ASCO|nr:hypothetical protein ASCRUDRAFT_76549 [Ascoidea rubescens DSM 1968]ODV60016.1 hypothetical protein ASCRUDRAFT_76549 [Ascoidea rubescens DSM 1968]